MRIGELVLLRLNMVQLLLLLLVSILLGTAASANSKNDSTTATTGTKLHVESIVECLECTANPNCWYCESSTAFVSLGKRLFDCYCDESSTTTTTIPKKPQLGYCGPTTTYGRYDVYANTEGQCIVREKSSHEEGQDTTDPAHQDNKLSKRNGGGGATSVGVLVTLILVFCCFGFCSGCASMYYICMVKAERDEEERLDQLAMVKVVTAREIGGDSNTKGSCTSLDESGNDTSSLESEII